MAQMQSICWTWWNYDEEDLTRLHSIISGGDDATHTDIVRFISYQIEKDPEGGNATHIQGYTESFRNKRKTLNGWKRLFGCNHIHIERRRSPDRQDAIAYTQDPEKRAQSPNSGPWSRGTHGGSQGERTDLEKIRGDIINGDISSWAELIEDFTIKAGTLSKNMKFIAMLLMKYQPKRRWPMEVIIHYGPSGTGKTRAAYDLSWLPEEDQSIFQLDYDNKAFPCNGYGGEAVLLLDEFRGGLKFGWLLRLLDRYPMLVNVKYGAEQIRAKYVIITTNVVYNKWYKKTSVPDQSMLMRRLNEFGIMYEHTALDEDPVEHVMCWEHRHSDPPCNCTGGFQFEEAEEDNMQISSTGWDNPYYS